VSLETTVITPRPGWQNQLFPANPFLMQRAACKSSAAIPEKFAMVGLAWTSADN
jgi:hypothetical protein